MSGQCPDNVRTNSGLNKIKIKNRKELNIESHHKQDSGLNPRAKENSIPDGGDLKAKKPDSQIPAYPDDDLPSLEFQQLRELFDREMCVEAPRAGLIEYKTLKKSHEWPGLHVIERDVYQRKDVKFWNPGHEVTLARYLRERTWLAQVVPRFKPDKKPPEKSADLSLAQKNLLVVEQVISEIQHDSQEELDNAI